MKIGFTLGYVELEPHHLSRNIISGIVYSDPPGSPWSFSAVHGPLVAADRRSFWHALPGLLSHTPAPKLLFGDFNGILQDDESWTSGPSHGGSASSSAALRERLNIMGYVDLGYSGPHFIWNRRRGGVLFQRARLDRAVATGEWCSLFPKALVRNVAETTSDHYLVVLNTNGDRGEGVTPFRFEAMWTLDIRSHWVVRHTWSMVPHFAHAKRLVRRIGETRRGLK
ncbi:Endonuclease/exonuclease/phosphatase [Trema orientale]|uniref:Endonuclease/exonuclease/phosphatase n=1 Tax=Trema orientale TaxID=63057 RepID=A0A2P5E6B6_TREOI|nr:Endonuclease/exonuclease/phosphatase [Trema orientale]